MNLNNALLKINQIMADANIENSQNESLLMLSFILNKSVEYIYTHSEEEISLAFFQKFEELAQKRSSGMPLAYLLGSKEFYGIDFRVNSSVLIPRPETEMMVNEALGWIENFEGKEAGLLILDVGTGSGCIPIAIAKNIKRIVNFLAIDFSEDALKIAMENIEHHNLENQITLKKSDLLQDLDRNIFNQKNVLITANLPYLSKNIYDNSPSSVQDFEPKEALISGLDGLDHYRRLFEEINTVILNGMNEEQVNEVEESFARKANLSADPSPSLRMTSVKSLEVLLEISPEQKESIEDLIKEKFGNKVEVSIKKDLAGKWRLVKINFDK